MDPQQELFTELLLKLKEMGYDVYDTFLPPEDTPYPFVYLADGQQTDDANKTAVFGNVYQTIHVWHNNPRQRGAVSTDAAWTSRKSATGWNIRRISRGWYGMSTSGFSRTTQQRLRSLHGLLEAEFKFS